MDKRGVGNVPGRERSMQRAASLADLEGCLRDVTFPIRRSDLLAELGDLACYEGPDGSAWSLHDLLRDVPVADFSSARHVAEVVQLRFQDMADVFRPGGGPEGGPVGPT